jgi:hypothetical protein
MSEKLEDVFEKPTKSQGKPLVKMDPKFKKEVDEYLDEVKKAVGEQEKADAKKGTRKNNVSEEGRKVMLANLKKGREMRKVNLNKEHERRQEELKKELEEVKGMLKEKVQKPAETPAEEPIEKQVEKPVDKPIEKPLAPSGELPKPAPVPQKVLFSMIKKPVW